MIQFTKIRWKNLLSTGNTFTEVKLDKHPTTLICGENGAGKTTLLDALTFVLYGKPYRGVNLPQLVNSINGKDCLVEIEFNVNGNSYKVTRGLAPKVFTMELNGKPVEQTANAKDYQAILESQVLKMNYKTFCQVVILGSTNYVPFMRLPAGDRRGIVENLLDIDVFSKMNDVLKSRLQDAKETLRGVETEISTLKLKSEHKKDLISKIEQKSDSQLQSYRAQEAEEQAAMDGLLQKRDALQADIASMTADAAAIEAKRDSLNQYTALKKQMSSGIKKAQEESDFYRKNEDCPVCKHDLPQSFRDDMISKKQARQTELEAAIAKLEDLITKEKTALEELVSESHKMSAKQTEVAKTDSAIAASKKYIKQLRDLQTKTIAERDSIVTERTALEEIHKQQSEKEDERKGVVEDLHTMEIATMLLKDSGIKRKIIKKYIPALNKIINKYLVSMDFFAQFTLNEDFVEIIKSRHRDEFSYENFSEGEKLRIDVSLLLAWRDIAKMKNSANTNLLILDEVFDSSLDGVGTEEVIKILQNMGAANNVFVISHKSDQLLDKFANIVTFKKVNNFSRLCTP
jgi:DNA repair exonuclease SbcCD ATPase subunit